MSAERGIDAESLLAAAGRARESAYAPYSGFRVGAAVVDTRGRVHTGVNVENASYGLTICAERSAVARAVAEGATKLTAVAIAGPEAEQACMPCGACRQTLHEFGPDMAVIVAAGEGKARSVPLRELLPEAFGPSTLSADSRRG